MSRPPHRTWKMKSALLSGNHPRTIEAIEFYEDSVSGQRCHVWPEDPPTVPGLVFDTKEDRNCVRELLLRIEDLEHDGKLPALRMLSHGDASSATISRGLLVELLEVFDVIRLKKVSDVS